MAQQLRQSVAQASDQSLIPGTHRKSLTEACICNPSTLAARLELETENCPDARLEHAEHMKT